MNRAPQDQTPPCEVVTLGEGLACLSTTGLSTMGDTSVLLKSYGGAEANTAVGLARLGVAVAWVSAVGDDGFGHDLLATLAAERVDISAVRTVHGRPTGVMVKQRTTVHDAVVDYYRAGSAMTTLTPTDLPQALLAQAKVFHLTGIPLALGAGPAAAALEAVALAHRSGAAVTFDPNFRHRLWAADQARKAYRGMLPNVTTLLCNNEEATLITGHLDPGAAARTLSVAGPSTVLIKRGARGVLALIDDVEYDIPAHPAPHPVDPVGAGDAFNAAWIYCHLRGVESVVALDLAAWAAAHVVEHPGDYEGFPTHTAFLHHQTTLENEIRKATSR